MNQQILNKQFDFDSLFQVVSSLNFEQKRQLWELLDQEMEDEEEQKEVLDAKQAYSEGDYLTLEDYLNQRKNEL
jgi:hypothetical protein